MRSEVRNPCDRLMLVSVIVLFCSLVAAAPDSFVGTWQFVPDQSRFHGPPPKDIRLRFVIDHDRLREEEVTVLSNGVTRTVIFIHEYDGKERPYDMSEAKHRTHAVRWTRIDERTVERRINHDDGKLYTTERLALSPDLNTLTETHFGVDAEGQRYETVETFVRQ